MAKEPLKVAGLEVRTVEGVRLMVFRAKDSSGRDIEMSVPAEGWDAVYEDGTAKIMAAANASTPVKPGEWVRSFHRVGTPAKVGTTDEGKVLLIARLGTPTETRLSFDRSDALALSRELFSTADRLPAPPGKH